MLLIPSAGNWLQNTEYVARSPCGKLASKSEVRCQLPLRVTGYKFPNDLAAASAGNWLQITEYITSSAIASFGTYTDCEDAG